MRLNLKNLTILQQTIILFGGFLVLAVINFVSINLAKKEILSFSNKIIEIERLNDDLPELSSLTTQALEDNKSAKEKLEPFISKIDKVVNTFRFGGQLPITKIEIKAADGGLKTALDKYQSAWTEIKANLGTVIFELHEIDTAVQQLVIVPLNDSLNSTTTEIQTNTITIQNQAVKAAGSYLKLHLKNLAPLIVDIEEALQHEEADAGRYLTLLLYFFLVFNVSCIIIVLVLIKRNLFNPLSELGHIFSEGNFDRKSSYTKQNELGIIAKSINDLADGLKNATSFVTKIGEGKLDEKIEGLDESHVTEGSLQAALLNMREQMKRMDAQDEERKWITEGLARFVDILRASDNVQQLGDAIISNLVEYTKSNQGGIYIINEEDSDNIFLELISLYAFNTQKFEKKQYRLGEGLVGQTYLEKKTIFLLEVPEDYIEIKSGLGDANPKNILLVPLKIENDIYGVIELASFHEFEEYQIQFVEKLGESIASTIDGVQNNYKTKLLLEESQQLTEQMQAQEEEMRQNMEELTATQEEMARKERGVTAQLDAINSALGTAEYDIDGNIITANEQFYKQLGYSRTDIQNTNFSQLHQNYGLFEIIAKEQSWSGWLEKNHKSGQQVSFKSAFSCIYEEDGSVLKILEIVTQFEKESAIEKVDGSWEDLKEVEEELRQNLEELDITQEQLDLKLNSANQLLDVFKKHNSMITMDTEGNIIEINEKADKVINSAAKQISEVFKEPLSTIINIDGSGMLTLVNDENTLNVSVAILINSDKKRHVSIIWG